MSLSLYDSLRRLGRVVSFHVGLAKIVGIEEAIMLGQLVYWTPRAKNEQGWVYKSAEDLEEETSLTYRQQRRVRTELCTRGLLQERYAREEHRLYLRVIPEAVNQLEAPDETSYAQVTKGQEAPDETSVGTLPNVVSYKETDITQDSTAETVPPLTNSKGQTPEEEERFRQQAEEARQAQEDRRAKKANKGRGFQNRNSPIPFRPANQGGGTYGARQSSEERRIAKQQRIREACERAQEKLAAGTL